jgi:hypothetical protein
VKWGGLAAGCFCQDLIRTIFGRTSIGIGKKLALPRKWSTFCSVVVCELVSTDFENSANESFLHDANFSHRSAMPHLFHQFHRLLKGQAISTELRSCVS